MQYRYSIGCAVEALEEEAQILNQLAKQITYGWGGSIV
jgi:hypothetical protein